MSDRSATLRSSRAKCVQCRLFGKPGTQYDFAALDIDALQTKAGELEEKQRGTKKKVNPKVMNMIDTYVKHSLNGSSFSQ